MLCNRWGSEVRVMMGEGGREGLLHLIRAGIRVRDLRLTMGGKGEVEVVDTATAGS